ncbi:MAG: FHA domain-containing protein [Planctomycetota bacterium]
MNQSTNASLSGYRIRFTRQNSSTVEHPLENGRSVFIGTGDSCGIQIEGEGVAAIHCLLDVEEQEISVQDWASESGTIVNGEAIEDKKIIENGDIVRLGTVTFELLGQRAQKVEEELPPAEPREESVGMESLGIEPEPEEVPKAETPDTELPAAPVMQPVVQVPANRLSEMLGQSPALPKPPATEDAEANDHLQERQACEITEPLDTGFGFEEPKFAAPVEDALDAHAAYSSSEEVTAPIHPAVEDLTNTPIGAEEEGVLAELDEAFNESPEPESDAFSRATDPAASDTSASDTSASDTSASDESVEEEPEHAFSSALTAEDLDWDPECLDEEIDPEIVQLLKNEIEDLRIQISERDEQISMLRESEDEGSHEAPISSAEIGSTDLVSRVDDLLAELEEHDEKVGTLQELLQSAEIQNHAEREERNCLETWVGEIEQRIGERESEWQAEVDALRVRLEEACEERDLAQRKVHAATQRYGQSSETDVIPDDTLVKLQEQNAKLQEELEASRKDCLSLTNQLERSQTEEPDTLQEERAQLAKEKAAVSRMRFELSKQLQDLGEAPVAKDQPDREFAYKLQTLRAHLKEIHEEERSEREQKGESLFGRISGLWKRVEDKY